MPLNVMVGMAGYQVFHEQPEGFDSSFQGAGCYCEHEGKILLVKRHPDKYAGNTWCIPGGKFEQGENAKQAVIREVYEEVGFHIEDEGLLHIGTFYIRKPGLEYIFHTFHKRCAEKPAITLALEEHLEFRWVTFEEALQLPLIEGGKEFFVHYGIWSTLP